MAAAFPKDQNLAVSRYTDISGEPVDRLLSPIQGYQEVPVVSLEKATEPIAHLFSGIEASVWVAKENCRNPADGLTQDESASIHLYTMQFDGCASLYQMLNRTLRTEDRQNLKPWFSYLKLLFTALFKLPSKSQIVWRGIRDVDLSGKYKAGMKFAWWGVSSCTTNVEVLKSERFLGQHGIRTLFSIECINGKSIVPHSYFKNIEQEVILIPGSYLEVIGQINPAPDLHLIQLKEIIPPFPLVKPPLVQPANQSLVAEHSKPFQNLSLEEKKPMTGKPLA
ncbi:unnamed protein product [Didymodactylos carnosus]|uniref:NAD(P)(+)--arginine ADP-ribosyltransferase n=1 Tax=Didymodactylos carnosus TaxID=1234261 RepID=A0A815L865_9BILA|nr:unnamed protein product [Didymodactylos carnosus]CAF1400798.1 unnamed protein product [Didymodactylos carnosus]CAF4177516.1 unnamed protein product [Didymodactylos carnosus]CAF4294671.1 unnamed protein product [Didymodactylos carnosus]